MKPCRSKKRIRLSEAGLLVILTLTLSSFLTGCASYCTRLKQKTATLYHSPFSEKDPDKKIWLDFVETRSFQNDRQLPRHFQQSFLDRMSKDSPHQLVLQQKGVPPQLSVPRFDSGDIDNLQLAREGRRYGFNVAAFAGMTQIETSDRFEGLMFFERTHHYVKIHCFVQAYDTETAAKLVDEPFVHEFEIDEMAVDYIKERRWEALPEIAAAVEDAAHELGEKLREALNRQRWTGYIAAVENDRVIISAGENVGLQAGDVFAVHDIGEIKEGIEGRRYQAVGLKIGEIEVISVSSDQATGQLLSGKAVTGGTIKVRR